MQILKFQVGIILLDSQDPRILEMLAKNVVLKALPLNDLSGAVSAYYQSSSEPVVLDTKIVEIANSKT